MTEDHRAILIRGNLSSSELMEIVALARAIHDRRPESAEFEIVAIDETSTINETAALMEKTLPDFVFRAFPFPR